MTDREKLVSKMETMIDEYVEYTTFCIQYYAQHCMFSSKELSNLDIHIFNISRLTAITRNLDKQDRNSERYKNLKRTLIDITEVLSEYLADFIETYVDDGKNLKKPLSDKEMKKMNEHIRELYHFAGLISRTDSYINREKENPTDTYDQILSQKPFQFLPVI